MTENDTKLRDAIFSLHTRKFGNIVEKLIEKILIEFGFLVNKPKDLSYDIEIDQLKDEIKGSRVLSKSVLNLNEGNIIETLLKHESNRFVNLSDSENCEWDCNIQQIKTKLFNNLWYVLFFGDSVAVFKIHGSEISEDKVIGYSNKQHRGNVDEGQFHVTNKNIKHHLEKYLVKVIPYKEVFEKLNKS